MNIRFYLGLLARRSPVMLFFIIICSGLGIITAFSLPPTYQTAARLLVEEAQIGTGASTSVEGAEQLQVIEQRLLTRANMLDIARKFEVFEDASELTPDEIVAGMVNQTRISRSAGRNQATLMVISFEARSGQIAANVLNEYLTIVQEESRSSKEDEATSTLAFHQQEEDRLSQDLDEMSIRIVEFKNQNQNALPEDAASLRSRQDVLTDRLNRVAISEVDLKDQREQIIAVYEATGQIRGTTLVSLSPEEQQLAALRLELEGLKAIYSDTYPKVVALQGQVDRLEAVVAAQPKNEGSGTEEVDVQTALLNASLKEIDDRLETVAFERTAAEEELLEIGQSLSRIAGNAIALDALEREHENIQARYNTAVNNLDAANLEIRVIRRNQGQRITVIEGASVPQTPTGPDRTKIGALGVGAGIGLAGAYFMLLEFLNRNIRRPSEIQNRFNIVPIAVIPYIESKQERVFRRSLLFIAFLAVLIIVPAILWAIDTYYLPLDLIATQILDKIGL